jgi:hypothetical protein
VDVPKSADDRFIALMLAFAALSAAQQARFLEMLNLYLFASPQRRRQYVRAWARRAHAQGTSTCGHCGSVEDKSHNAG